LAMALKLELKELIPPHRVIDALLDGALDIITVASETISSVLDKGPLGSYGPHRSIDAIVKHVVAMVKTGGEGIATALDKPLELIGVWKSPTDIVGKEPVEETKPVELPFKEVLEKLGLR